MSAAPAPHHYDLVALGSGPAGQGAALEAAALGRRVAIVEREPWVGGGAAGGGTLPFLTLRAAVSCGVDGPPGSRRRTWPAGADLEIDDLMWRAGQVVERERRAVADRLRRARVDVLAGCASFVGPRTLLVRGPGGDARVSAGHVVIAVGTVPARPPGVEFDGRAVVDAEDLLRLRTLPRTLTIVGGGTTGLEYASLAAALGARVTVVDRRTHLLETADRDLAEGLTYHLRGLGVRFRLGERVEAVEPLPGGGAVTHVSGGTRIASDLVLHAAGRRGATSGLGLQAAGLRAGGQGRIAVDDDLVTARSHILAAGDVAGGPARAAVAMEDGRRAARGALGERPRPRPDPVPWTVNTIPEVAWVGRTEQELAEAGTPWVAGLARFRDLARGDILNDRSGFLKLLVRPDTRRLLGVHILGTSAGELVHLGQVAVAAGVTVDDLAAAVYAVPTLAEAYRVAALRAIAGIGGPR